MMTRQPLNGKHRAEPVRLGVAVTELLAEPELHASARPDALSDAALLILRDRLELELLVVSAEIAARQAAE